MLIPFPDVGTPIFFIQWFLWWIHKKRDKAASHRQYKQYGKAANAVAFFAHSLCKKKYFQVACLIGTLFPFAPHAGAGTSFSLLRQRKGSKRKATAGTGLASPNFPHSARFFGRARHLRLRRFEHASPCSPKNRAPFGCASRRVASGLGW